MKPKFDFDKAAEAEEFGVLAIRSGHKNEPARDTGTLMTEAQQKTVLEFAHSVIRTAKAAGAADHPVTVGDVSLQLHSNGEEDILSIRSATR